MSKAQKGAWQLVFTYRCGVARRRIRLLMSLRRVRRLLSILPTLRRSLRRVRRLACVIPRRRRAVLLSLILRLRPGRIVAALLRLSVWRLLVRRLAWILPSLRRRGRLAVRRLLRILRKLLLAAWRLTRRRRTLRVVAALRRLTVRRLVAHGSGRAAGDLGSLPKSLTGERSHELWEGFGSYRADEHFRRGVLKRVY